MFTLWREGPIPLKCALQSINIISSFLQLTKKSQSIRSHVDLIKRDTAWAFSMGFLWWSFSRSSQVITLSLFPTNIVNETRNFCELMALKLTLHLAQEKGISHLYIYGNSLLVIQWMNKGFNIRISPWSLFFKIFKMVLKISPIYFSTISSSSYFHVTKHPTLHLLSKGRIFCMV